MATGLLLLCVGPATRLVQFLTGLPKEYVARVRLGVRTTTDDSDGDVEATSEGWRELDQGTVQAALGALRGRSWQTPPRFSAKKIGGEAAHYRARRGETVALAPVEVDVLDLELLEWQPPDLELRVRCSSGTYVRALARDLGEALSAGAHLSALRRTAVGEFRVESALPIAALSDPSLVEQAWITPAGAVAHLPWVEVGPADAARLSQGQAVAVAVTEANSPPPDGPVAVLKGRVCGRCGGKGRGAPPPPKSLPGDDTVSEAFDPSLPPGIPQNGGTVVTVGTFDGVHRGHWEVLQEIRRRALSTGRRSVLLTFDPHPLRILRPEHAPPLLTTSVEKKEILAESGLDYAVFLSFTPALSRYQPRRFVEEVLVGRLGVKELVIGYDHGFGQGRSGSAETLRRIGDEIGFAVDVVAAGRC